MLTSIKGYNVCKACSSVAQYIDSINENRFYYYKVIIVFVLPTNHSYKCPYGSKTVPYSGGFVVTSLCFFLISLPKQKNCNYHNHYKDLLAVQLTSQCESYSLCWRLIPLRFNSESSLKGKVRGGACKLGDLSCSGDYCQGYSLTSVFLFFIFSFT